MRPPHAPAVCSKIHTIDLVSVDIDENANMFQVANVITVSCPEHLGTKVPRIQHHVQQVFKFDARDVYVTLVRIHDVCAEAIVGGTTERIFRAPGF
jgi:hypothetical protein